jgi:hypothetical protein
MAQSRPQIVEHLIRDMNPKRFHDNTSRGYVRWWSAFENELAASVRFSTFGVKTHEALPPSDIQEDEASFSC